MDYFEFYDLKPSFLLDEADLKKRFLRMSKQLHPDFHTLEDDDAQAAILDKATINTEAYRVLQDFDNRVAYILKLKGFQREDGQNDQLPKDFLMDMMDLNENLMELQFDFDKENFEKINLELESHEKENFFSIQSILENFDFQTVTNFDLEKIKIFSQKKKYFLRIRKTLTTFAAQ